MASQGIMGVTGGARSLMIQGQVVEYHLRRSRRHSIGLQVDHRGLRVGAPPRASLAAIEALIVQHGDWVLEKLASLSRSQLATDAALSDGGTIAYLGQPLRVEFPPGLRRARWGEQSLSLVRVEGQDPALALARALKPRARALFLERLAFYSERMGVSFSALLLSAARTRWGSCNARGEIRLNWRLIHLEPGLIDYVVVHELAHLQEMNHSPRFWAVVEQFYPDWRQARATLRQCAPENIHLRGVVVP